MAALNERENAELSQLLLQMARGEQAALADFYERSYSRALGYAYTLCGGQRELAEDLVHDAYLKAFERADRYRPTGNPLAWFMTLLRHLILDHFRREKRQVDLSEGEWAALPAEESDRDTVLLMRQLLAEVDSESRQIIFLHLEAGLAFREIAAVLNKPQGTVAAKYRRALIKLAEKGGAS